MLASAFLLVVYGVITMSVNVKFRGIPFHHTATHTKVEMGLVVVYNGVNVVAAYPVHMCEVM